VVSVELDAELVDESAPDPELLVTASVVEDPLEPSVDDPSSASAASALLVSRLWQLVARHSTPVTNTAAAKTLIANPIRL
jgi:hypothetical protein